MRLASFNVENLFLRARALNGETVADGTPALEYQKRLNQVLARPRYTARDKRLIVTLLQALGLAGRDDGGSFVILRQNRGKLVRRGKAGLEVVAKGRDDWIGWVDLKTEEVNDVATRMTARVIADIDPDVLAVVEAESRPALLRFSEHLLPAVKAKPFEQVMLIDGNDDRGIDVGIMTRNGYRISSLRSHVDDKHGRTRIFSRDCAAYTIATPAGNEVVVLVNHFKSRIGGGEARRLRQAQRVRTIYEELVATGHRLVAVVGDLNDTPGSRALKPLLDGGDLRDISEHPAFDDGAGGTRPGTFGTGTASNKIDYVLLSPALFEATRRGGVFRKGVWAGARGDVFSRYPEITKLVEAASDHAAIWAEIGV